MYDTLEWWQALESKSSKFRCKVQLQGKERDIFAAFELPKVTNYTSFFHMVKRKNDVLSKELYDSIVDVGTQRFLAYSKVKYDAIVSIQSASPNVYDTSLRLSQTLGVPIIELPKRGKDEMCPGQLKSVLDFCVTQSNKRYVPLILESFNHWLENTERNNLSVADFAVDLMKYWKPLEDKFNLGYGNKIIHARVKDILHSVEVLDYIYKTIDLPRAVKIEDKWVEQKYLFVDDNINTGETIKNFLLRDQVKLHKYATFFCLLGKHKAVESISKRVKMF